MSEITGFGCGAVDVSMSDDKTEISITVRDTPIPMNYKIRSREDGTLEIVNLDDDQNHIEEIEAILNNKIWAQENHEYESYELIGKSEAAEAILKYVKEHFVAKN